MLGGNSNQYSLKLILIVASIVIAPLCLLTISITAQTTQSGPSNNADCLPDSDSHETCTITQQVEGSYPLKCTEDGAQPKETLQAELISPEPSSDETMGLMRSASINEEMKFNDNHKWRNDYFYEQVDGFELRVFDESFDERLANVVYTVNSVQLVNSDYFAFNSGDPKTDLANMEAMAGPQVDQLKCDQHLGAMIALMDELGERLERKRSNRKLALNLDERHFRLARVLDSYGRYEPGHWSGRTLSVGHHEQCVSTYLLLSNQTGTQMQYEGGRLERAGTRFCWAHLSVEKHLNSGLKRRARTSFEPTGDRFMLGVCLPESCHTKTLAKNQEYVQRLVDSQFKLPNSLYLDESLTVDSVSCPADRESEHGRLPTSGRVFLVFVLGWLMVALYATTIYRQSTTGRPFVGSIMDSLDLRESLRDFIGQREATISGAQREKLKLMEQNRKIDLNVLNPVKTFGTAFVVLGHAIVAISTTTNNGLKVHYMAMEDPLLLLMLAGTFVVDTFFVITGLLIGYLTMKRANTSRLQAPRTQTVAYESVSNGARNGRQSIERGATRASNEVALFFKQWFKFAINRHLALVPMLILVFCFKKTILINLGVGWPLWDPGFNRESPFGACRQQSWMSPFWLLAAFMPLNKQCLAQTWSVATDLFFSLTLPPVFLLMSKKPKSAFVLSAAIIVISNLLATQAYYSIDPADMEAFNEMTSETFVLLFGRYSYLYSYPQFRFCSVLTGLLAGYYLYKYEVKSGEQKWWPNWIKWATMLATMTLLSMGVISCALPNVKNLIRPYQHLLFPQIFTTVRLLWAASNAILFLRMASDWRDNFLMRLFAGRLWQSLSKLSYSILLIHMDLILYVFYSKSSVDYFTRHIIITGFGEAYLCCLPAALCLYVVFENPISKLVKRVIMPTVGNVGGIIEERTTKLAQPGEAGKQN